MASPAPAATAPLAVSSANTSDAGPPSELVAGVPVAGVAVADRVAGRDAAAARDERSPAAANRRGSPGSRDGDRHRAERYRPPVRSIAELVRTHARRRGSTPACRACSRGYEAAAASTPRSRWATLYFLGPYNLLVYGVNDAYDYESDLRNPRKASLEGANVPPDRRRATLDRGRRWPTPRRSIGLAAAGRHGGRPCALGARGGSRRSRTPRRRCARRSGRCSTRSRRRCTSRCRRPAATRWPARSATSCRARPLAAFVLWGMASHALGAIQDVAYDRAAGIASVGTASARATTALAVTVAVPRRAASLLATLGGAAASPRRARWPTPRSGRGSLVRPDEQTARRAWRCFMGLNLPAGALVTELLLAHWGVQADVAFLTVVAGVCVRCSARVRALAAPGAAARGPPRRRAGLPRRGRPRAACARPPTATSHLVAGSALTRLLAGAAIPVVAVAALAGRPARRRSCRSPPPAGLALLRRRAGPAATSGGRQETCERRRSSYGDA